MKLAAFILLFAAPVSAQEFSLPTGCDAYLTVQNRDGTQMWQGREFITPVEAGFLSRTPEFGCGVTMSSFEVTP
ncbi:MAG: hypothetical protein KC448_09565 [Yoonia sp.]|nr:hypothetical protein [Yoonia sp.]